MPVRWLAITSALLFSSLAGRSVAQNATRAEALAQVVRVEPAEDACLNQDVVRARVLKRLARGASLPDDVHVTVYVADAPRLEVARGGRVVAERRFEGFPARCNARRDAIAVAVALAIERMPELDGEADGTAPGDARGEAPNAATTPAAGSVTPGEAPGSEQAPPPDAPAAPNDSAAPLPTLASPDEDDGAPRSGTAALRLGAHAGVLALAELLPSLAAAGVLGAELALPETSLRFALSALASLVNEDARLGATIESRLLLGRLLGCTAFGVGAGFDLEGCAGVLAGAVLAQGRGYATTRGTELAYAALLARAALRYPAGGVISARIALDGLAPVVRPSYAVRETPDNGLATLTPAPIGGALSLEIVLSIP